MGGAPTPRPPRGAGEERLVAGWEPRPEPSGWSGRPPPGRASPARAWECQWRSRCRTARRGPLRQASRPGLRPASTSAPEGAARAPPGRREPAEVSRGREPARADWWGRPVRQARARAWAQEARARTSPQELRAPTPAPVRTSARVEAARARPRVAALPEAPGPAGW